MKEKLLRIIFCAIMALLVAGIIVIPGGMQKFEIAATIVMVIVIFGRQLFVKTSSAWNFCRFVETTTIIVVLYAAVSFVENSTDNGLSLIKIFLFGVCLAIVYFIDTVIISHN